MSMPATDQAIDILNRLLRGELSATETYDQALERDDRDSVLATLRHIRVDHQQAVLALQEHIKYLGGAPSSSSGVWGTLAHVVEGAAKLLGTNTALSALRQGEHQGLTDYEQAATHPELPAATQELIRTALLPQTRMHVETLDRMLGSGTHQ